MFCGLWWDFCLVTHEQHTPDVAPSSSIVREGAKRFLHRRNPVIHTGLQYCRRAVRMFCRGEKRISSVCSSSGKYGS